MPTATPEANVDAARAWVTDARPGERQDDAGVVAALRAGDEAAFALLVDRHHAGLIRLAMVYVRDRAVAEEVAQDAWLGVLRGVHRFQGHSSLKTWLFGILVNCARARARRERRSVPFSALTPLDPERAEPAVEPERFRPADDPQWPGHWASFPPSWGDAPEERLLRREARGQVRAAIESLPPSQREVVLLRDVQGWTAAEVCAALQLSEGNQRVLLHRGRARVRRVLEEYLAEQ